MNILLNLTNNVGDKNNFIQICFNRLIKSPQMIRNFVYTLNYKKNTIKIEKIYSNSHLLSLCLLIVDKIISSKVINKEILDAMSIIANLSENWTDLDKSLI